jgi:hypothetical protein
MICNLFAIFVSRFWVLSLLLKNKKGIIITVIIVISSYDSLIEHLYI